MTTNPRSKAVTFALATVLLLVGGCSSLEIGGTDPGDGPAFVSVFLHVPEGQSAVVGSDGSFSVAVGDGEVELTIVTAELIWDDLAFARIGGECVTSDTADDGDACSEVTVQPSVLDLRLESSPQVLGLFQAPVEPGSYERFQFDLHVVQSGETGFITQGFQEGTSTRVVGSIEDAGGSSGVDALFGPTGTVDLFFDQELDLEAGESASLTLTVDVASWFLAEDGSVIDPEAAAAGGQLAAEVRENIAGSFDISVDG